VLQFIKPVKLSCTLINTRLSHNIESHADFNTYAVISSVGTPAHTDFVSMPLYFSPSLTLQHF